MSPNTRDCGAHRKPNPGSYNMVLFLSAAALGWHPALPTARPRVRSARRRASPPALGVHFSYFFDTDAILSKLGSIHDGGDTPWSKKLLQNASGMATGDAGGLAAARTAIVRKVRSCEVPIGLTRGLGGILNPTGNADIDDVLPLRKRNVTRAMAIGVLPAMPGWPKRPIWE